ncbi:hypothetical protein OQA88_10027 [Cercophora sp. LCS_1]
MPLTRNCAAQRLFAPIYPPFRFKLAMVEQVTSLVIRRQMRHRFFHPFCHVLMSRPRLEHLIYEPWRQGKPTEVSFEDEACIAIITKCLSPSLKSLAVFEDFNHDFTQGPRNVNRKLAGAFAARSVPLKELAVSHMIDAEAFFHTKNYTKDRDWIWPDLESLALTAQLLCGPDLEEIPMFLASAAATALKMPKLKTMVLWYGDEGVASAFIYQMGRCCATVSWRGTWKLDFDKFPGVVEAWTGGARERGLDLRVEGYGGVEEEIESHGDAIHYLGLPCQVATPASLWQIRKECARWCS